MKFKEAMNYVVMFTGVVIPLEQFYLPRHFMSWPLVWTGLLQLFLGIMLEGLRLRRREAVSGGR